MVCFKVQRWGFWKKTKNLNPKSLSGCKPKIVINLWILYCIMCKNIPANPQVKVCVWLQSGMERSWPTWKPNCVKSHLSHPPQSRFCSRPTHFASWIFCIRALDLTDSLTLVGNKSRVLEEHHHRTEASRTDVGSTLHFSSCFSLHFSAWFLRWCHFLWLLHLLETS